MVTEKVKGYVQLWYFGPFGVMNNCFAWYIQYPGVRCPVQSILPVSPSCLVAWCGQPRCWGSQYSAWLLPLQPQPSVKATIRDVRIVWKKSRLGGRKSSLPSSGWRSTALVSLVAPQELRLFDSWISLQESWAAGIGVLEIGPWGHGGTFAMVVLKTTGWMGEHWQCGIMWTSGRTFRNGLCSGTWSHVILHESWKIGHIFLKYDSLSCRNFSDCYRHNPKYLIL